MKNRIWCISYFYRDKNNDEGFGTSVYECVSDDKLTIKLLEEVKESIKEKEQLEDLAIINTFEILDDKEIKEHFEITELEKQLLIHFKNQGAQYIARDEDKSLFLYMEKPFKVAEYECWDDHADKIIDLFVLSDLFTFVKWEDEEPIKIDDVLENCVVVEE